MEVLTDAQSSAGAAAAAGAGTAALRQPSLSGAAEELERHAPLPGKAAAAAPHAVPLLCPLQHHGRQSRGPAHMLQSVF